MLVRVHSDHVAANNVPEQEHGVIELAPHDFDGGLFVHFAGEEGRDEVGGR